MQSRESCNNNFCIKSGLVSIENHETSHQEHRNGVCQDAEGILGYGPLTVASLK